MIYGLRTRIVGLAFVNPKSKIVNSTGLRLLLAFSLLWIVPALACGSFAPRPTPEPTETPPTEVEGPVVVEEPTAPAVEPTATLIPTPEPTEAPVTETADGLAVGVPAFISAPNGLNLRGQPTISGAQVTRLNTDARVSILAGPEEADGYTWWRLDDGDGNIGWAAERDDDTVWISPVGGIATSGANNSDSDDSDDGASSGERVRVTVAELSVRAQPSTESTLITRVREGATFNVVDGPQEGNGYTWLRIRSDDGAIEGWAADGGGGVTWLTPIE